MTVRRFLDLSTNHLPQRLGATSLSDEPGVIAHPLEHGWLMWVPEDPDDHAADYPDIPAEVLAILRYASERDCDYVLFDADADRVDDLPTWTW